MSNYKHWYFTLFKSIVNSFSFKKGKKQPNFLPVTKTTNTEFTKKIISKLKTISEEEFNKRIELRSKEFYCLSDYQSYTNRQHTKNMYKTIKKNLKPNIM